MLSINRHVTSQCGMSGTPNTSKTHNSNTTTNYYINRTAHTLHKVHMRNYIYAYTDSIRTTKADTDKHTLHLSPS